MTRSRRSTRRQEERDAIMSDDLRSTMLDVLSRLLSTDTQERLLAEQQLQALQVIEGQDFTKILKSTRIILI